jgi:UPF0716 protein FxsA
VGGAGAPGAAPDSRAGRGLTVPLLLVVALVGVPILELYVLLQVGQVLGVLPTLVLLVLMSLVGAWLLRREGTRAWQAFRGALASGRLPAKEVADGALVILGGALLLTPGFATDAFGLCCVIPPTRAVLRRLLTRAVAQRLQVGGVVGGLAAERLRRETGPAPGRPGRGGRGDVVDGEVTSERTEPPSHGGPTPPPA